MNPDQIKPSAFTQQWKIGKPAQMICSDTSIVFWLLSWLGIMTMFQMRKYLDLIHRIFWLTSPKYLWSDAITKFNSWTFRYILIMDSFPSKLQPNLQSLIKDPAQLTKQNAPLLNAFEIKSIDCRRWKNHPRSSDLAHITDSGESIGKAITFNRHASGRPSGNIRSLNTWHFPHVFIRSGNIILCTFSNWFLCTVVIVLCMHQTKSSEVTVLVMYFLSDQF